MVGRSADEREGFLYILLNLGLISKDNLCRRLDMRRLLKIKSKEDKKEKDEQPEEGDPEMKILKEMTAIKERMEHRHKKERKRRRELKRKAKMKLVSLTISSVSSCLILIMSRNCEGSLHSVSTKFSITS